MTAADRSKCELEVGELERERGDFDRSIVHINRSISLASEADRPDLAAKAQLRLLWLIGGREHPDATGPLLGEVRSRVYRVGTAELLARLHAVVAEIEGRRGLLRSARRHCHLSQALLGRSPNIEIEAYNECTLAAVAIMEADFEGALEHGRRSEQLAKLSGAIGAQISSLGNLGNVFFHVGDFERCERYLEQVIALSDVGSEQANAARESLAQLHLTQGHFDECLRHLSDIEDTLQCQDDRTRFVYRYAQLTRTVMLSRMGQSDAALESAEQVVSLAQRSGDVLLNALAVLSRAEVLDQCGQFASAALTLRPLVVQLKDLPSHVHATYERIVGQFLIRDGKNSAARGHFERARRICEYVRSAPALKELLALEKTLGQNGEPKPVHGSSGHALLQGTAALMLAAGKPELVARELVEMMSVLGCFRELRIVILGDDGDSHAYTDQRQKLVVTERICIEFTVQPCDEVESVATLNAINVVLSSIRDLERAGAEREERLTLWPPEDVPLEGGDAVVNGQMRDRVMLARRVATTNVSVLITGESGTGKEILARAVHTYSDRAHKPFIPFNCTAVPRELLDSQLFGHRRGAFTGADRDNPGLVRSAREGTLFLDEIGELGFDLQPKLLRFLESGEICPLGESAPFKVDVRIIAATNSNLEDAVKAGRFREDLFYRLNVIRLDIPPLRERRDEIPALVHHFVARAATDFKKGDIRVAEPTMEQLLVYRWPGNVRQLNNELRRMVALAEADSVLMPSALSPDIAKARSIGLQAGEGEVAVPLHAKLQPTLARVELEMIKVALRDHRGRVDAAARALGISRKGLYLKRQRLGL